MKQMGSLDIIAPQMGDDFQEQVERTTQMGENDNVWQQTPHYPTQQQKPYTEADRIREQQAREMGCDL